MTAPEYPLKARARQVFAFVVLAAASQVVLWCCWFAMAAFFRLVQDPGSRMGWESVRAFALTATWVVDGIASGGVACLWSVKVLVWEDSE